MKFLCLGTRYMTSGASLGAVMVAKSLIARGHECEIWFLMRFGELDTQGVKTRIIFETRPFGAMQWLKLSYEFFTQVRQYNPDVTFSFFPLTNILGALTKFCGWTRCFVASQRNPAQVQSKPIFWTEMLCGSTWLYDANIAVSQSVVETCMRYPLIYRKKLRVVYNGVPELPQITQSMEVCRAFFNLPPDKFVIGSLGRLDRQKRVDVLIDMMACLPESFLLVIAGTGGLEQDLRDQAKRSTASERIIFVGNLQAENVSMFYRAVDVFAFATSFEGFGRTLVEAFSMDTPVIATDIPVLREVGGDAAVYAANTAQDWADAVNELAASAELRAACITKGKERTDLFSLPKMLETYHDIAIAAVAKPEKS